MGLDRLSPLRLRDVGTMEVRGAGGHETVGVRKAQAGEAGTGGTGVWNAEAEVIGAGMGARAS